MTNEHGLALGLVALSTALLLGWRSLERKRTDSQLRRIVAVPWVKSTAIFLYFVGIPYLALILGILTTASLGLKGLDHLALIDLNSQFLAAEIQRAVTLMFVQWLVDSSATILAGSLALLVLVAIWLSLTRQQLEITLVRERVWFTIYVGIHWAFYRAVFWSVTDDLYLGVVFGVSYVLLEWGLTYRLQGKWSTQRQQFLVGSIVLVLTSAVFFYSPNLWLLLPVHIAMVAISNRSWGVETHVGTSNPSSC